MKLLFVWLINTIIVLPFKVIRLVIKIIYQIIKNIYFNNLNLDYINNLDGYPLALKLFKKQLLAVFIINVTSRLFLLIIFFLKQL